VCQALFVTFDRNLLSFDINGNKFYPEKVELRMQLDWEEIKIDEKVTKR